MDFQRLKSFIPKPSNTWSHENVAMWLSLIHLSNLIPQFQKKQIDGKTLFSLTEDMMENELGISSSLVRKKLNIWIKEQFKNYDEYLKSFKQNDLQKTLVLSKKRLTRDFDRPIKNIPKNREFQQNYEKYKIKKNQQLFIQNIATVKQKRIHISKLKTTKIGRGESNQIKLSSLLMSRVHAEILFENDIFYIQDLNSADGTYVQITDTVQIKEGTELELSDTSIKIGRIAGDQIEFTFWTPQLTDTLVVSFSQCKSYKIGRSLENYIHLPGDPRLSKIQGQIFQATNNKYYYSELSSLKNGSWFRLRGESMGNSRLPVGNKSVIRLANEHFEFVLVKKSTPFQKTGKGKCPICYVNINNGIVQTCGHNCGCFKCLKNVDHCPICRVEILSLSKIYRE